VTDANETMASPETAPTSAETPAQETPAAAAPAEASAPEASAESPAESPKKGPVVVVRRAGGAVETRGVKPEPKAKAEKADKPEKAEKAEGAEAKAEKRVVPQGPSVADEVPESESFAEMFEKAGAESLPSRKMPRVGEKVKGKIFQLGAETVFLTIGKHEAMIDLDELKDEEGVLRFGVGDEVEAFVTETGARGIMLSRKLSKDAASLTMLSEARNSGMPIEGLVVGINKGGLEVAVGEVRAFCPMRQVDVRPVGKADDLLGQRLTFRVTEVKERKVVLSRRAILEEELKAKAAELREKLSVGAVLKGRVVNVQNFGAFVDLGGLEGLIPASELSHMRVNPNDVVKTGDEVEVEVIRLEAAEKNSPDKAKRKERITLSMRARMEDPYKKALETLKEGEIVKGKVVRLQPFGAFVELMPAVDGLIHISAMSDRRIAHPRDVLKVGDEVEVKIEKLDPDEKRIGLRLVKDGAPVGEGVSTSQGAEKAEKGEKKARPRRGNIVTGKVDRVEPFGVFIEWDGNRGLIPASETGTDRGTDLKRVFSLGQEVKAEIIEAGDKLKLSITAALRSEERADLNAWKAEEAKKVKGTGGFNSLADKLKGLNLKV